MNEATFLTSLIGFFLILTPLVFIHELGHYYAAVKSGVSVESFSIGFGPEIFGFTDNYVKVKLPYDKSLVNQIVPVNLTEIDRDGIMKVELAEVAV